jgi:hypothetical protein
MLLDGNIIIYAAQRYPEGVAERGTPAQGAASKDRRFRGNRPADARDASQPMSVAIV